MLLVCRSESRLKERLSRKNEIYLLDDLHPESRTLSSLSPSRLLIRDSVSSSPFDSE